MDGGIEPESGIQKHPNDKLSTGSDIRCARGSELAPLRSGGFVFNERLYVDKRDFGGGRHGELPFFRPMEYELAGLFRFDEYDIKYTQQLSDAYKRF